MSSSPSLFILKSEARTQSVHNMLLKGTSFISPVISVAHFATLLQLVPIMMHIFKTLQLSVKNNLNN